LISNEIDEDKIGCGYYSKAREMICGETKNTDPRSKLPYFYCFDCKRKIYKLKQHDKAIYFYNLCLKDVEDILKTNLIMEEQIKLIKNLKKEYGNKRE
jgi:hypothetical protein